MSMRGQRQAGQQRGGQRHWATWASAVRKRAGVWQFPRVAGSGRQAAHLQPEGVLWGVQPRPAASIPRCGGAVSLDVRVRLSLSL